MKAEVRVTKSASGKPMAEVAVPANISAAQLGTVLHGVVTNPAVLRAGGLGACGACKSGLDVSVIDTFPDPIIVEFQ